MGQRIPTKGGGKRRGTGGTKQTNLEVGQGDACALKHWMDAAKRGEVEAQYFLGEYCESQGGSAANHRDAFYWFSKAAAGGHAVAQLKLGEAGLFGGSIVPQNHEYAFKMYEMSAAQNNILATFRLGQMHEYGYFVRRDARAAQFFYERAFSLRAQFSSQVSQIPPMRRDGMVTLAKPVMPVENQGDGEFFIWYSKAALETDPEEEEFDYRFLLERSKFIPREMLDFYAKKAAIGEERAQFALGLAYYSGTLSMVSQDWSKAYHWFLESANQGYANAQMCVAWMYEHGEYVEKDLKAARKWYLLAAKQGSKECSRRAEELRHKR